MERYTREWIEAALEATAFGEVIITIREGRVVQVAAKVLRRIPRPAGRAPARDFDLDAND